MTDLIKTIVNVQTGEINSVAFTEEEIAQVEIDWQAALSRKQAEIDAQVKREVAREKLAALGLTLDDLQALGL
jgi:S-adenosylhomocysteine hydrolase